MTDATVDVYNKAMTEVAERVVSASQSVCPPPTTFSAQQEKAAQTYKTAIDSGKLETKSYLGNKFREQMKSKPEFAQYQKMDRAEQAQFRLDWCKLEYETIVAKKVQENLGPRWIASAAATRRSGASSRIGAAGRTRRRSRAQCMRHRSA